MNINERVCKWCMVPEEVANTLDEVEICEYCTHDGGHEWLDDDRDRRID